MTEEIKPTLERLTRRQVLKSAAGTGLLLLLPMLPSRVDAADHPAMPVDQWIAAGPSAKFPLNQPQRISLRDSPTLFVTRLDKAKLAAVSAKCTHRGCEVYWNKAASQLSCPCHSAAFSADGTNLRGPRSNSSRKLDPLAAVQVREKDGQVEVNFAPAPPPAALPPAAPPPPQK